MKDQINTIRDAAWVLREHNRLHFGSDHNTIAEADKISAALTQLEAMVGEQEPVAWQARFTNEAWRLCAKEHHELVEKNPIEWRGYETRALYAAPVAQQPQEIEVQCPVCNHKFYEWPNDKQPQAEAVPVVDRVYEAAKRLVDHADFQLGGVLSAKSKARDIPSNAASKVKARHLASLRDALAKTPQQAEPLTDEQRLGWYAWRVKDLEEKLANAQKQPQADRKERLEAALSNVFGWKQPQAEPFGYVSQHTNGTWEFSPTPAGVYPDTAKSITAVYAKQPQAEPDFTHSKTAPTEIWKNRLNSLAERLEMADGAVAFEREVVANLRERLKQPQAEPRKADVARTCPFCNEEWVEQPQAEAVPSDVVRDAERLDWLLMQVSGKEFRRVGVEYSGNCQRADIDAAIAQQKGQP